MIAPSPPADQRREYRLFGPHSHVSQSVVTSHRIDASRSRALSRAAFTIQANGSITPLGSTRKGISIS